MAFLTGKAGPQQALVQCLDLGNANRFTIQGHPASSLSSEELVPRWVVHDAGDHFIVARESERDTEDRKAVCEVRGPVERINIPETFARALGARTFFSYNPVTRKCRAKALDDELLGST